MTPLVRHLADYHAYHRDRRNVATHAIGIPLIVLAVELLLSRPVAELGGVAATPAFAGAFLATLYYLRLDLAFGAVMGVLLAIGAWAGLLLAQTATPVWLAIGIGLFVVGWIFQLVGHQFEGRKPAFIDDLKSLMTGPLFVLAEAAFALGLRGDLKQQMEQAGQRAG